MMLKYFLLAAIHVISIRAVCDRDLLQSIEWTGAPYNFASSAIESLFKSSNRYISKNNIATRFQIYGDYAYLAVPRYLQGVPATVARVSLRATGADAILEPFPCWTTQEEKNCKALQSVVDLYADAQGVLWLLDIGVLDTLGSPVRACPPKVVAISLATGKLLRTIDLSGLVSQASRLQYIVAEYSRHQRPYIYISDAATRSILVFDVLANRGYRVVLPKVITSGCSRRDVLYIALVRKGCGNNYLVFTYLCSKRVFSIRTDYLRSGSTSGRIVDLGVKPKKLVILGTDLGSAIFFRYEGENEIYRWDTNTPFAPGNFLDVYKSSSCFLSTQVAADVVRQRLRVLESTFPDFIQGTVGCGAVQQLNVLAGSC